MPVGRKFVTTVTSPFDHRYFVTRMCRVLIVAAFRLMKSRKAVFITIVTLLILASSLKIQGPHQVVVRKLYSMSLLFLYWAFLGMNWCF